MYTLLVGQSFPCTARVLTSTGVIENFVVNYPMFVKRIQITVTTATVSSGGIVVKFYKYPVAASSSNAVEIGSLTIPGGVAAGKVYYKDVTPVAVTQGNSIAIDVTTAAAGGGAAGAGYIGFLGMEDAEVSGNNSNMVASA